MLALCGHSLAANGRILQGLSAGRLTTLQMSKASVQLRPVCEFKSWGSPGPRCTHPRWPRHSVVRA